MSQLLPALKNTTWDVLSDDQGFSAEGSAERPLECVELERFETAAAGMAPVVRAYGRVQVRGMATIDEDTLWVYVHAVGPGPYDESAARAAEGVLTDLWRAIHTAAAED
jgi:hypothetical protein